jgi:cell wall-associated NlpC family hydrolase
VTHDPRLTLARPDLADARLQGLVPAAAYRPTRPAYCRSPFAGIRSAPDDAAEQPDQLLFGETFHVLDRSGGWAWGQAARDGYVGFVREGDLGEGVPAATHEIAALGAYGLSRPDIKAPGQGPYSLGALVTVTRSDGRFAFAEGAGWLVQSQLRAIGNVEAEPVAVAEQFLGAPYLWGGRQSLGLDCSGLVQVALQACGRECPRDTDMQEAALGVSVSPDQLRRGDLVFWTGHVGWMVDDRLLLHASGGWAAVVIEPLIEAARRIRSTGRGEPTAYRRL